MSPLIPTPPGSPEPFIWRPFLAAVRGAVLAVLLEVLLKVLWRWFGGGLGGFLFFCFWFDCFRFLECGGVFSKATETSHCELKSCLSAFQEEMTRSLYPRDNTLKASAEALCLEDMVDLALAKYQQIAFTHKYQFLSHKIQQRPKDTRNADTTNDSAQKLVYKAANKNIPYKVLYW